VAPASLLDQRDIVESSRGGPRLKRRGQVHRSSRHHRRQQQRSFGPIRKVFAELQRLHAQLLATMPDVIGVFRHEHTFAQLGRHAEALHCEREHLAIRLAHPGVRRQRDVLAHRLEERTQLQRRERGHIVVEDRLDFRRGRRWRGHLGIGDERALQRLAVVAFEFRERR
jgi:hypothetical protein